MGHFLQKWRPYDTWEDTIIIKRGSKPISKMSALTDAAMSQSKQQFQSRKEQHRPQSERVEICKQTVNK